MSLIKEALDKAEQENNNQPAEPPEEESKQSGEVNEKSADNLPVSTLIWSVIIVILAIFIGGQLVFLLMFLMR